MRRTLTYLFTYLLSWLGEYKIGNISETVEDRAKVTFNAYMKSINQSINQLKTLKNTPYGGLNSPIRRRSRSLGSGHKGCFEQISFEMFSECPNSKSKTVSALGRQTVPNSSRSMSEGHLLIATHYQVHDLENGEIQLSND